jgi:sulfatase modifying factor 1
MIRNTIALVILWVFFFSNHQVFAANRTALVIGNSEYKSIAALNNPVKKYYPAIRSQPQLSQEQVTESVNLPEETWQRFYSLVSQDKPQPEKKLTPQISSTATPGKTWQDTVTGIEFVWVPKGCFQMGQTESEKQYLVRDAGKETYNNFYKRELPRHEVCIDGFWMAKHEVTNRQYRMFKQGHTSKDYKGVNLNSNDQPVVYVSWNDANAFVKWLNNKTGHRFSLPTEAQWEYAARAGTNTIRFWGDNPDDACQYANVGDLTAKQKWSSWTAHNCSDGYAGSAPVGSFAPNNFGLHDMLGNVWEWCEDVYDKNAYSKHSRNNPLVTSGSSNRVDRGGGWDNKPGGMRSAYRSGDGPAFTYDFLGFRLIRTD